MKRQLISSRGNQHFKHLKKLNESPRYRHEVQQTILDGIHLIESYAERFGSPDSVALIQGSDIDKIASYVLFPHWKTFSSAQKTQFTNLLTQNVVRTFQRVSKKYLGSLEIVKVAPVQNKANAYDVHCKVINAEDGRTVDVRFQIASGKVRNLFVEKLDLVDAKRKEYASLMRQNRNVIPAFLKAIGGQALKRGAISKPASVRKA